MVSLIPFTLSKGNMLNFKILLLIFALIFAIFGAFDVPNGGRVSWHPLAFAFFIGSLLI